jgi:chaperonin cofactor prefoldin
MTDISGYYVGHLQEIVEQQRAEIERLNGRVATLVELRKFDRSEIERLRAALREMKAKCGDPRIVSDIADAALEPKS